jgi:hemin uptake protein HemP
MKRMTGNGDNPAAAAKQERWSPPRISSTELFAGQLRLLIEHQGVEYLLQITRQGKLILTK